MFIFSAPIDVEKMNIHMKSKAFTKPLEVNNRLRDLGLELGHVRSVIEAMAAGRANSTKNDPSSAPGLLSWIMGVRRLREELLPLGWKREDLDQVPTVVNNDTKVRISVMNTDSGTGLIESSPKPRSKKGAATERAVSTNQLAFSEILEESSNTFRASDIQRSDIVHWYICVFCEGDLLRAELSCPTRFEEGNFSAFQERIFIQLEGYYEELSKVTEFDIPVIRKGA